MEAATSSPARTRQPRTPLAFGAGVALALIVGCGGEQTATVSTEPVVERFMAGDTSVVRTVSGSAWGTDAELVPEVSIGELDGDLEYIIGSLTSIAVGADGTMYAVDGQGPELRAYDAEGRYLRTLGRAGEGPGEINRPDGGLVVLSDGRLLVRDPGNARLQVFLPGGEPGPAWGVVRGGFNTSSPLWWDRDDNVYINVLVDPEADVREWRTGLARITPSGSAADTLLPPDAGYEPPALEARVEVDGGVNVSRNGVPFTAGEHWAFHPDGYFVHGVATEYAFTLGRPDGPLRVERVADRVPVQRAEKAAAEERATRNMRFSKPDWRWNGPPIPDEKPAYRGIHIGRDGRIWISVSQPGVEEENPDFDPAEEFSRPTRWVQPAAFDVFEDDGTYLGRVTVPRGFSLYPTPTFDGDFVWATTRDDLGVQRLVRFRVTQVAGA